MRTVTLATCTLNQWAMDFDGNYQRILHTIIEAKEKGAAYRCGPELEVTGYGCSDHFYESDTFLHSWEVIVKIMEDEKCSDIIIDIGMPVMHKNVAYNCRVIFLNKKLLLIRPKKKLCDNGIYRESRWFTGWTKDYQTENFKLPSIIHKISGQIIVPIGDAVISTVDTCIGFEICEELWNPDSSLVKQCCDGVEITFNSSGGFHEIGRTRDVINVIKSATKKCGGVYVFSNLRGGEGDYMYYHGTSHITVNGNISAIGEQFSLKETETVVATIDLDDIVSYRNGLCIPPSQRVYPNIEIDWYISSPSMAVITSDAFINPNSYDEGEEIALGPACWLWDYLRRSDFNCIFLSLNGDLDSCSSALIVFSMCDLVCKSINEGDLSVLSDLRKIVKDPTYIPSNSKELCRLILVTCHLESEVENDLRTNPDDLAKEIGCNHYNVPVENIIFTLIYGLFLTCTKLFRLRPECKTVFTLQSTKDRIKMIILYILSEILSYSKPYPYRILVLGQGNADKVLFGNFAKYGCFSGDLSLTGGINEKHLKEFLQYSKHYFKLKSLDKICVLTIEESNYRTQEEIYELNKLIKENYGPYSAFCKLASKHGDKIEIEKVSIRVKHFFYLFSLNRHKKFSLAPCFHLGSYAIGNSYYDQHQILYNNHWTWQFCAIDRELRTVKENNKENEVILFTK